MACALADPVTWVGERFFVCGPRFGSAGPGAGRGRNYEESRVRVLLTAAMMPRPSRIMQAMRM